MIKRKVQVLVATMNQMSHRELLSSMNITGSAVVINQVTDSRKKLRDLEHRKSGVIFASFFEKGLSRSRNRALAASSADICVVADDDLRYIDGYEDVIRSGYTKYPDADIIAFEVDYSNEKKNKKSLKEGRVGLLYSMKISSVRISFRRESVIDAGVQFDENFGAGTDNFMGEENIFLAQCIRKGLKVYSVPKKIATLQDSKSTWFKGFTPDYFIVRGKVFRQISTVFGILLCIRFAIRKRDRYEESMSIYRAVWYMLKGYCAKNK